MDKYIILCTEEQTKKALELGAPIIIPTAEQMIGWLEEHGFWYVNISYYVTGDYWCYHGVTNGGHDSIGYNMTSYNSRKEATLAAIDAALEYLKEKQKK